MQTETRQRIPRGRRRLALRYGIIKSKGIPGTSGMLTVKNYNIPYIDDLSKKQKEKLFLA